jgi:hypothetical protein
MAVVFEVKKEIPVETLFIIHGFLTVSGMLRKEAPSDDSLLMGGKGRETNVINRLRPRRRNELR